MKQLCVHVLYGGLGGHGAVLISLLRHGFMRDAQHKIIFIGIEPPQDELITFCENAQIPWYYQSKRPHRGNIDFIIRLGRRLNNLRPDVIFLHGLAAAPSLLLLDTTQPKGRPFIILRETQANHLKSHKEWFLLAVAHAIVDRIVHLTDEAALGASNKLGILARPKKMVIIPNGIDIAYYSPIEAKRIPSRLRVGMQSRLQPNKDHATLLSAFAYLLRNRPSMDVELHIAGDGATHAEIVRLSTDLGITQRLVMRGTLTGDELRDFLHSLDVYVHCTYGETMSTAIMQALACGLPVVASDVPGVRNMIVSNAGVLYEHRNAVDLMVKIERFLTNSELNARFRKTARDLAIEKFSINRAIDAYEMILPEGFRTIEQRATNPGYSTYSS
jgi:glycosyltransferase involved in cell wall biosynthesis